MEKGFLDKVKDNAAVRIWSEKTQQEKDDSLTEGYMSELWDFTRINMTQNNLQELKEDLILAHPDTKKRVDVFALCIYGLVIFPKVLGHINDTVLDLFDWLDKRVTPIPVENVSYRVFSENYSPLKEFVATPRRDDISEEKWMAIL
ncbi:hypothetical protein Gotri_014462 [Gossypium trilobum]|uniref:Uncharacterized protein n=1 Tax=Gossypium trilobum TaxID=34281 RepID=A0A7J9DWV8_9ROSI|nr:hypothetical protein [Gossypium trilobum]